MMRLEAGTAGVTIRHMQVSDVESVAAIASMLPMAPHWAPEAYFAALDSSSSPQRVALVALAQISQLHSPEPGPPAFRKAPEVVGFAVASVLLPQAEIETVAVTPGGQRRGTGRKLLAALLDELKRLEVTEVLLEARISNSPALGLYRSFGFQQTAVRPRYYADPQEDAVLMALQLPALFRPQQE